MINVFINEEYDYRYYLLIFNGSVEELKALYDKAIKSPDFSCLTPVKELCTEGSILQELEPPFNEDVKRAESNVYIHWHESDDSCFEILEEPLSSIEIENLEDAQRTLNVFCEDKENLDFNLLGSAYNSIGETIELLKQQLELERTKSFD